MSARPPATGMATLLYGLLVGFGDTRFGEQFPKTTAYVVQTGKAAL